MRKRGAALLLAAALAVTGLAGCGASSGETASGGEKVRLMVWSPQNDQSKDNGEWLQTMCEAFAEEHPEWDITFVYGVADEASAAGQVSQDPEASADVFMFANDTLTTLTDASALAKFGGKYREEIEIPENGRVFSVEYLPGQFDQRADSAVQCVKFLNEEEDPIIRTATTYLITGSLTDEEFAQIKAYCINPVDSRETGMVKPDTLETVYEEPADVKVLDGFAHLPEAELKALYDSLGLAMTFRDFAHIQNYFAGEEHRDPTMTEIRVLDTYWSDHCRHTTFSTELKNVAFEDGYYSEPIKKAYQSYLDTREELFAGRKDKFVCLMDLALAGMRKLKKEGKLPVVLPFSLAALISFYNGTEYEGPALIGSRDGEKYLINDSPEVLEKFASLYKAEYKDTADKAAKIAHAVLSDASWWGEDLTRIEGLEKTIAGHLETIWTKGMKAAVESL